MMTRILISTNDRAEIHKVLKWSPFGQALIADEDGELTIVDKFLIVSPEQSVVDFIDNFLNVTEGSQCVMKIK